ncbi:stage 0 sporulation protein [bacterium]|nr:stage 0 sporulation protein [bacterium]
MKVISIFDQFMRKEISIPQPDGIHPEAGDFVVYRDDENRENIGRIHYVNREEKNEDKILTKYSYLRKATAHDKQKMETLGQKATEAMIKCKKKIKEHKLDMLLEFTEYSLDGSRINFIFTSDDRVDFRELVKDLAKIFQKQIHLQQIGPRDKARIVTGVGKCGKPLCCASWLKDLQSITMDMVRSQSLESKGSAKLSGACGKLMCCLRYEVDEYKKLKKNLPKIGSVVKVKKGEGQVISLDILNQKVRVLFPDRSFESIPASDIKKIVVNQEIEGLQEKQTDPIVKEL